MFTDLLIKRYNTYYQGWSLSFGEHEINTDQNRDIYWLIREDRIGMAVAPKVRRIFNQALLGHNQKKMPKLVLDNNTLKAEDNVMYQLTDDADREGMQQLMKFLDSADEYHLFLTSHFCYPKGTRILTFSKEKPTILLYKEMQPIKLEILS